MSFSIWISHLARLNLPSRPGSVSIPASADERAVVSKAFWGGLWGALLALFLTRSEGIGYWLSWIVVGAVAPSLVAMYGVPLIKGLPVADFWPRAGIAATVNGAWGLGTGFFLRLFGTAGH